MCYSLCIPWALGLSGLSLIDMRFVLLITRSPILGFLIISIHLLHPRLAVASMWDMFQVISSTSKSGTMPCYTEPLCASNHPLAHLMQSVFSFHDKDKFKIHLYALTPSDDSIFRKNIEVSGDQFLDVSQWSNKAFVERIVQDQIHIRTSTSAYWNDRCG